MEAYIERIIKEKDELAERYNKLQDFMRGDKFPTLERKQKTLLYEQAHAMLAYLEILGERIEFELNK